MMSRDSELAVRANRKWEQPLQSAAGIWKHMARHNDFPSHRGSGEPSFRALSLPCFEWQVVSPHCNISPKSR
jgi:hypothetical protein